MEGLEVQATNSYDELVLKQRKEKKDLQSKIQALKKTATKGDKKKKKEVGEEIAKLEADLEKKHADELVDMSKADVSRMTEAMNNVSTSEAQNDDDLDEVPGLRQHKVTKAQRRREKKATQLRERELRIGEQEADNIYSARNVETETIKTILRERGLQIQEVPSDGNCLYCAIDEQLKAKKGKSVGVDELRLRTSQVLRENRNEYLPFLSHPDTGEILTEGQYDNYCDQVANTPAWGGQVELKALSIVLKCKIEVIQAEGPPIVLGEEHPDPPLTITYHRHIYGLGEHYNSVRVLSPDSDPPPTSE